MDWPRIEDSDDESMIAKSSIRENCRQDSTLACRRCAHHWTLRSRDGSPRHAQAPLTRDAVRLYKRKTPAGRFDSSCGCAVNSLTNDHEKANQWSGDLMASGTKFDLRLTPPDLSRSRGMEGIVGRSIRIGRNDQGRDTGSERDGDGCGNNDAVQIHHTVLSASAILTHHQQSL